MRHYRPAGAACCCKHCFLRARDCGCCASRLAACITLLLSPCNAVRRARVRQDADEALGGANDNRARVKAEETAAVCACLWACACLRVCVCARARVCVATGRHWCARAEECRKGKVRRGSRAQQEGSRGAGCTGREGEEKDTEAGAGAERVTAACAGVQMCDFMYTCSSVVYG
jgi:hypothetical protein